MKYLIILFLITTVYTTNIQDIINNLIQPISDDDVSYYLYTLSNLVEPDIITNNDVEKLGGSHFDAHKDLLFITHGWEGSVNASQFGDVRQNILAAGYDINVFEVDWSQVADANYIKARAGVGGIGRLISTFIGDIQSAYGVNSSQILLVGLSLGAHVVGVAAAGLAVRPHSVIGLDPAAPLFSLASDDRIRADCADHVEIIHTNAGFEGWAGKLGTSDFYLNGGTFQVGCGVDIGCAHVRSFAYYAASILPSNAFIGRKCANYLEYVDGVCNGTETARMGMLYVDETASGIYYLNTSPNATYNDED